MMRLRMYRWLPVLLLIVACNLPTSAPVPIAAGLVSTAAPNPSATPVATATPKPLDINHRPLYWFGPLPAKTLEGETDGSSDFMDLFNPAAPWTQAAGDLQVFQLYGGWAVRDSTPAQLSDAIRAIRQRGLALAVETGPLTPTDTCGSGLEGFAGEEGLPTLERIKSAGGELNFIAFDEPFFNAHLFDGPQACHWSIEKTAQELDAYIQRARTVFPDVIVGDTEPVTGAGDEQAYNQWMDSFRAVNGYNLAFLHLDVAWAETTWPAKVKAIEDHGRESGVPVGIIYGGNFQDPSDEAWLSIAGERVKRYELETGGQPEQVVFQSWNDKPDHVLPESNPYSFTGFIKAYFEDKNALGFRPDYFNGILSHGKTVKVSRDFVGFEGRLAVDGDLGTFWNSGQLPPNWIQIDLGQDSTVTEIRLVIEQWPAGDTVHQIWAGADAANLSLIHEFNGYTHDPDTLEFKPAAPLPNIRYVKIITTQSPSWTSWREIEVLGN